MLKELLSEYDSCQLECDGLTRVLHTVLARENIEHTCMVGSLTDTKHARNVPLHFWIGLPDGKIIDYRARMWLGDDPSVPHGIFYPNEYPEYVYQGSTLELEPLSPSLFNILVNSW
jgi:hypothetical protein